MSDSKTRDISYVSLEDEMRKSYLDYAMSVIVSRALPDVRDGLKPVHRRILYAMKEGGYDSTKAYKKSARIVGDVMGKYHPHGDNALYDAMVRMAQPFSLRLPLVDGQGNFGSMDGDPAAAMRYTEARMAKSAESMLDDIDKDTVDFAPNYDDSTTEPTVLPARFPNLLVNGAGGIAVGMATNIPPHNLTEVIDACCAYVDDNEVGIDDLMQFVTGPDFPTGAKILGQSGIRSAYHTGRGSVIMRAVAEVEEMSTGREHIVITEIPYQVNKARLIERMAELVNAKTIEGISDIRDESDRDGVRVVVELKRGVVGDVILNQLYRHTPLQTSFGVNMLALDGGRPKMMNLKEIVAAFVEFREDVISRRTTFLLGKAREKAHVLIGLAVSVANIDEVIALIRAAGDPAQAREDLMARAWPARDVTPLIELVGEPGHGVAADGTYQMSEVQARAILDLKLHRLTGLERDKIGDELKLVTDQIAELLLILTDRPKRLQLLKDELIEMREKYGDDRRTVIEPYEGDVDIEDLIQREEMVVSISHAGYIKRVPLDTYRAQKRGGKGRTGMATKEEDFVADIFVTSTHTPVLFFTSKGMVHKMKVYRLPLATPQSRGKALVNLLPLSEGETITTVLTLPEDEETWDEYQIMFATSGGGVRRNKLSDFANIRANGLIAMKLPEDDSNKLMAVRLCREDQDVLLATKQAKMIRFPADAIRIFAGRSSMGVRGIKLAKDDEVISMSILNHVDASAEERVAYLKRSRLLRGEEEMENGASNDDEDVVVSDDILTDERFAELAQKEEFILSVSSKGFGKRTSAYEYRTMGRGGQGVWGLDLSGRGGCVVRSCRVEDDHQVMMITNGGQLIRMNVTDIRTAGRRTQGVTLFRIGEDEEVVAVARLAPTEADEGLDDDEAGDETAVTTQSEQETQASDEQ